MKRILFALAALSAASAAHAVSPNDLIVTAGAARYSLSSGHSQLLMLDDVSRGRFTEALKLDNPADAALWGAIADRRGPAQARKRRAGGYLVVQPACSTAAWWAHWTRVGGVWQAMAVSAGDRRRPARRNRPDRAAQDGVAEACRRHGRAILEPRRRRPLRPPTSSTGRRWPAGTAIPTLC
ncbi:MAG: hypothetical protein WDN06_14445 [Asticcacaulis sp.]